MCFRGCDLRLLYQSHFVGVGLVYMEKSGSCKSAERVDLEGVLRSWFATQGVSEVGATRALTLLDASTLLAEPRPSRWNRRGAFGIQERCRYLWYRHVARILGWCERRRFPDIVTGILRTHVFPTQAGRDEATREDGASRVPVNAHAGPPQIATDPSAAGQSSTFTHNTRPGFWDSRRLVAALHHRSAPADFAIPLLPDVDTQLARDRPYRESADAPVTHPRQSPEVPRSVRTHDCPNFAKTLRKSHIKPQDSSRIDIPTSFWRTHGVEMFDDIWYTLHSPMHPGSVKTTTRTYGKQTFCSFTIGWLGFCAANALKLGDKILFTKVGVRDFEVTKL